MYIDYLNDSIKNVTRTLFSDQKNLSSSEIDSLQKYYVSTFRCQNLVKFIKTLFTKVICVRCICGLSERLSHFNFANDIIQVIVHQLTSKTNEVAHLAADNIIALFKADKDLKLSLEITQKLTKMLRQKSYGVKSEVRN